MAVIPVTKEDFGQKRFVKNANYAFAMQDAIAPLVLKELARAMMHVPVAFATVKDALMPVAVQSLVRGRNFFVTPQGRWIGRYTPAFYRSRPFMLAPTPDNRLVLCCDDASDAICEQDGQAFFTEDGSVSEAVQGVLNFLTEYHDNYKLSQQLCVFLDELGLIEPWQITLKDQETGNESRLEGLSRVNEKALHELDADALVKLQKSSALPLIYCQVLSMQHIASLGEFGKAQELIERKLNDHQEEKSQADKQAAFLADDTTISFENL